jgi:hypothetical protein
MDDVRKMELMAMSENESEKLSLPDRYDRIRLIRQKMGMEAIKNKRPVEKASSKEKTSPRYSNNVIDMKKIWSGDSSC